MRAFFCAFTLIAICGCAFTGIDKNQSKENQSMPLEVLGSALTVFQKPQELLLVGVLLQYRSQTSKWPEKIEDLKVLFSDTSSNNQPDNGASTGDSIAGIKEINFITKENKDLLVKYTNEKMSEGRFILRPPLNEDEQYQYCSFQNNDSDCNTFSPIAVSVSFNNENIKTSITPGNGSKVNFDEILM